MIENERSTSTDVTHAGLSRLLRTTEPFLAHQQEPAQPTAMTAMAARRVGMVGLVRIGIRAHLGLRHAYLDAQIVELEARRIVEIRPLCHQGARSGLSHIYDMVLRFPFRNLGGEFDACLDCRSWMAKHPHEVAFLNHVIVDDDTVSIHGVLPVPRSRQATVRGQPLLAAP